MAKVKNTLTEIRTVAPMATKQDHLRGDTRLCPRARDRLSGRSCGSGTMSILQPRGAVSDNPVSNRSPLTPKGHRYVSG